MAGQLMMDPFEQLVGEALESEGYWIRRNVILRETDAGMVAGRAARRAQLDIVAYKPGAGRIEIIECKGFQQSYGIGLHNIQGSARSRHVLRLFHDMERRDWVSAELKRLFLQMGLCRADDHVRFTLACARIVVDGRPELEGWSEREGFRLLGPEWIKAWLEDPERPVSRTPATLAARLLKGDS